MKIKPIELRDANAFVAAHHRHHQPVRGHRFSIQIVNENGELCGVAIAGRPVARMSGHPLEVLEITRVCTDGTKNACSKLYAAMARIAKQMGYKRIQTYTLEGETGISLKAAGGNARQRLLEAIGNILTASHAGQISQLRPKRDGQNRYD